MARNSRTCESSSRTEASPGGDAGAGAVSWDWLGMVKSTKTAVVSAVRRSAKAHWLFTNPPGRHADLMKWRKGTKYLNAGLTFHVLDRRSMTQRDGASASRHDLP